MNNSSRIQQLASENEALRARLDEAEETLGAIGTGDLDALIISGLGGEQIITIKQAQDALREQATLLDISHTLASTLEFKPALILEQLCSIVPYSQAVFFVLEALTLKSVAWHGTQSAKKGVPISIRLDRAEMLRQLFNRHHPIRIADVSRAGRQARFMRSLFADAAPMLFEGVRTWMWVPLAVKGRIIGGMALTHTERAYFTSHHAGLALIVANQAAITMLNMELYQNAQSLAVLQERQRLAQNLHDAVNQSLFSANLIAEILPRLWERDQGLARQSLEDLRRLMRSAMAEMRALLAELQPSSLTDSSLGDLLRGLGSAFTGRNNIPVAVTTIGKFTLPADVQIALYRMSQEALQNVAKHAAAGQVEINLDKAGAVVELRIRDNGRGFDSKQISSAGHYGLSMMRERAKAAAVLLSVTSRPGHGTELMLRWKKPLSKEPI